jgi:hypothetical protein
LREAAKHDVGFAWATFDGVERSAAVSRCGRCRWWLRRTDPRGGSGRVVAFLMLNPSTADAQRDDPTIRRCLGFARAWGYSVLEVRNLFAWRATDPRELLTAADPVGGRRGTASCGRWWLRTW